MAVRSLSPLILPGAIMATALLARGLAGVILAFIAALLVFDRALDRVMGSTGWDMTGAERSFLRLTRERRRAAWAGRLRHRSADRDNLVHLADDTGWAAVSPRRRVGPETIAIASIVGTVDRHKAVAFDRWFRPPRWSRGRWTLMYLAAQHGTPLPPISVYRVGDEHFVRDGHHRVSVARTLGAAAIEADVVELGPNHSARSRSPGPARDTTRAATTR
jgi:hypothetical protein